MTSYLTGLTIGVFFGSLISLWLQKDFAQGLVAGALSGFLCYCIGYLLGL